MTDSDRIRSMDDEQLADFLKNYHMEDICILFCDKADDCTNYSDSCVDVVLSWLESEYKG